MAREGQEGHSYETLKQMVLDWQRYAGTQHVDIMRLSACMHALQREIFAMREQERQRLSTAETMRLLTGGQPKKGCGCGDEPCLHGIPAALPDGDAPPAVQRPDYLGIARDHPLAVDAYLNHQSREFQLPASLLVPINTDPPPVEEQPPPIVNHHPVVQDLVRRDIDARKQVGIERYGTPLQPFNGRDPMRDLYEELLDAVMYVRQVMYEKDRK